MINVAGVGIVNTSDNKEAAEAFVRFLLRESSQQYFNTQTNEYPLAAPKLELNPLLVPLSQLQTPNIDLTNLEDLDGTPISSPGSSFAISARVRSGVR